MKAKSPAISRAWERLFAAIGDHLRRKPLSIQHRFVYERSLIEPVDLLAPRATPEFTTTAANAGTDDLANATGAPHARPSSVGAAPGEIYFRAHVGGEEAYHMRVVLDRAATARLVPCALVPDRVLFIYDCYTESRYRGLGLYPAALTHLLRDYRSRGYEKAFIRVHWKNRASIAGIEKAGFTRCGAVWHIAVFGFSLQPLGVRARNMPQRASARTGKNTDGAP